MACWGRSPVPTECSDVAFKCLPVCIGARWAERRLHRLQVHVWEWRPRHKESAFGLLASKRSYFILKVQLLFPAFIFLFKGTLWKRSVSHHGGMFQFLHVLQEKRSHHRGLTWTHLFFFLMTFSTCLPQLEGKQVPIKVKYLSLHPTFIQQKVSRCVWWVSHLKLSS